MKFNKWTVGLAAIGVVSLASAARADEKMSPVQTALSNTTLSGYVDVSAQWNLGQQNGLYGVVGNTPRYAYGGINKADGFNLNAVDIALDKPQDESPWAAGYHVELVAGPDNPTKLNVGTVAGVSTGPIVSQISSPLVGLRQAYVTLRTPVGPNGIDWKMGVFDTIIGYESTSSPLNPNYTRSYGYSIEPTTHTGLLASYKVGDSLTITAGVADGSNIGTLVQPINGRAAYETQKAYMGAIALTAPDSWGALKGATLNLGVINSVDSNFVGAIPIPLVGGLVNTFGTTSWYAGLMIPTPNSKLKFGSSFDYLELHNKGAGNSRCDSTWNVAVYGNLQATDKLSFNARAEYLDDSDAGLIYGTQAEEVTLTTQYNLWANVLSRVEFRWDHVEHGQAFDQTGHTTFTPNKSNAFMLAFNLIYQF
jgi:hypothetical protein